MFLYIFLSVALHCKRPSYHFIKLLFMDDLLELPTAGTASLSCDPGNTVTFVSGDLYRQRMASRCHSGIHYGI